MAHRRGRVNSESMHQILEQIRSVALSAADKHGLRNGDRERSNFRQLSPIRHCIRPPNITDRTLGQSGDRCCIGGQ